MRNLEKLRPVLDTGGERSLVRSLRASTVSGADVETGSTSLRDYIGSNETATILIGDFGIKNPVRYDPTPDAPQQLRQIEILPSNPCASVKPTHNESPMGAWFSGPTTVKALAQPLPRP